jgi:TatD DNase family protein
MQYIDTHCHIHDSEFLEKYKVTAQSIISRAAEGGVVHMICVGTDVRSSEEAIELASQQKTCSATVALHPHEASKMSEDEMDQAIDELDNLIAKNSQYVVAVGECGLDYYYHQDNTIRAKQVKLLRLHLKLAEKYNLPVIFHIREAFEEFFKIVDEFDVRGVIHSFTAHKEELQGCIKRGFYIGLNGIMTFTKDSKQLEAARMVPIENLVIETDAPFLTPKPFRGNMNEPKHVTNITLFLSELRDESHALLAEKTTKNAKKLFQL